MIISCRVLHKFKALAAAAAVFLFSAPASAVVLDYGESIGVGLVTPVENNTGFRVWGSKYYPGDVLPLKMEEYMLRRIRAIPRVHAGSVQGLDPDYWEMNTRSPRDLIVRIGLEEFSFKKTDTFGSKVRWDVALRLYVYDSSKRLIYDTMVEERGQRHYPFYSDVMEHTPVYWEMFEKSPCWPAIRHAMDEALQDVVGGYNGYRIVGRIAAKAERVDGSLTVPENKRDKLYHINLGMEDSIRVGDLLAVTRSSSVRTITPETPEMHFPQVTARVRVVFVKGRDGVVEIVKESKDAPIQLGDAVSAPLFGRRGGGAKF
ncbi:MAG: hypothetical protein LBR87_00685 [Synergistaceae bacterium]|jgi:hypothetical protein|nr:hypothetical protein [Synergistaceae bacterium]